MSNDGAALIVISPSNYPVLTEGLEAPGTENDCWNILLRLRYDLWSQGNHTLRPASNPFTYLCHCGFQGIFLQYQVALCFTDLIPV